MVSKFNPLFNGEQALLKAEATLGQQHNDDFDQILPVYRLGTADQASNVKPDLERAIEKGSKVIQTRSMLIKNEQKNRFIDDSYILVGKARFYQKDYIKALETFNYVMLQYSKSKDIFEAKLWAARCKTELNNYLGAKEDFEEIYDEEKLPKKLKGDVYASFAQLEINQKKHTHALQLLEQAIEYSSSRKKKIRWLFICGQLQAKLGNDFEASEIFRQVIRKGPPYELLFQAQLNRARSYDVDMQDPAKAFDELEDMLRDDKNFDNRDQIYYVMAEVAEKIGEEEKMEEYLKLSVRSFTTNNKQKALSYLKLAEYNFKKRKYIPAEAYFDSTFNSLDSKDPRYIIIQKRKESLNNLIANLNVIENQDSLQKLASMSEEDRVEAIEDYIFKLKDEDEAKKLREQQNLFNTGQEANSTVASAGKWYFYNTNLRSTGVRDFTNLFGNRKLEDNWRRKNKQVLDDFAVVSEEEAENAAAEEEGEEEERYKVETYLKDIPLTPEALVTSNEKIIQAFQNAGRIYKDELDDLDAAVVSLEDLLERYSEFSSKTRVWYTLYRVFVTLKNEKKSEYYKRLILAQDAESEYAYLIQNADSLGTGDINLAEEAYVLAYQEYNEAHYKTSLKLSEEGMRKYSESPFLPKFHLLKAFDLIGLGKKDEFIKELKLEVDLYPGTEEAEEAKSILEQLDPSYSANGEAPKAEGSDEETPKTPYVLDKKAQHKYVVLIPNDGSKVNELRVKLTDFNKKFFGIDNLRTKSFLFGKDLQMITISNFNNSDRAVDYYRNVISQKLLDPYVSGKQKQHFVISSDNFPKFYSAQNVGEYLTYFQENYLKK